MKLSIRSILTALVATFAFALPLSQAHAHYIRHSDNDNHSGSNFERNFDGIHREFHREFDFDGFRDNLLPKLLHFKQTLQGEFGEQERDWGNFEDRYCYCDNGKCDDDGNHNVPEPTPLALLGLGLGIIGLVRRFAPTRRS